MEAKAEQPERPWTPSYSVTTQGPASPAQDGAEASETPSSSFPASEVAEHGPKLTTKWVSYQNFISTIDPNAMHRPSLSRLAPVKEPEQADAAAAADVDSPTRARHESTTSTTSRAIPGGWVSGAKSSDTNKASLDHAPGEISSSSKSKADKASRRHSTHEKKKSKGCIIM